MATKKPVEFGTTQRLQRAYEQGIRAINGRVLMPKKPEQSFADWVAQLVQRSQQPDVQAASYILATRMISKINIGNQRTWREAAARSSQSQKLYRLLQAEMAGATGERVRELIAENAKYISSVPIDSKSKP